MPGIMRKWLELASAEPDASRRADYGGLALVFAEAAGREILWREALKEWNVIRSKQVQEWKSEALAEGRVEGRVAGRAEAVVELLTTRFGSLPNDLVSAIHGTKDLATLKAWFSAAARAASLEDFRQVAKM